VGQDSSTDAQGNPLAREVLDMLHAGISDGERQTDTIILVHIPQNGRKAIAISFPHRRLRQAQAEQRLRQRLQRHFESPSATRKDRSQGG
jgi:hypothetical protein